MIEGVLKKAKVVEKLSIEQNDEFKVTYQLSKVRKGLCKKYQPAKRYRDLWV
jgi:hypothetical protein